MELTALAPEPSLLLTKDGRERMAAAIRKLYETAEIEAPPRMQDQWILVPAEPLRVYRALQQAAPDWVDLFVVGRDSDLAPRAAS